MSWPSTAGVYVHVAEKRIYVTEVTKESEEHQLRFVGFLNNSDDQCFNTEILFTSFDLCALKFNVRTNTTGEFTSLVSSNLLTLFSRQMFIKYAFILLKVT